MTRNVLTDQLVSETVEAFLTEQIVVIKDGLNKLIEFGFSLDDDETVEILHVIRVACRRCLVVTQGCKSSLDRSLRHKIQNACAPILKKSALVRDLDVLAASLSTIPSVWPELVDEAYNGFLRWIEKHRKTQWKSLAKTMKSEKECKRLDRVMKRLAALEHGRTLPPPALSRKGTARMYRMKDSAAAILYQAAADITVFQTVLPDETTRQVLAGQESPDQTVSAASLHRLRLAFKKFRYLLEFLSPLHPASADPVLVSVKAFQDLLGIWHDSEFRLRRIERYIARHGDCPRLLNYFNTEEAGHRKQVLDAWQAICFSWFYERLEPFLGNL